MKAQMAMSAIFCQSANPACDVARCTIVRLCRLRVCGSFEKIHKNATPARSINAKAVFPKSLILKPPSGWSNSCFEGGRGSLAGSSSSIVCSPMVRSSPSSWSSLACRVRLSRISSVVAVWGPRVGRFPLKPKRYFEREGRPEELIRSSSAIVSRFDICIGVPTIV